MIVLLALVATFYFLDTFLDTARAQTPPPPAPLQASGRTLNLEECIAIALEGQPRIQATLADYAAARYRVNQALAPLLPQLSGAVTASTSS